jgi:hypothetical protein
MDYTQKLKLLESRLDICQNRLDDHERRLEIISARIEEIAKMMKAPTMSEGARVIETPHYKLPVRRQKGVFGEDELADLNAISNLEIVKLWSTE